MNSILARNWWALALRGLVAILFGLAAFILPGATLGALVLLFGAYMLVDGIFAIVAGIRAAEGHQRWAGLIFEGVLNLIAGVVIFVWPGLSLIVFIYIAGFWAIVTGAVLLSTAFRLHREHGEWLLVVSGLLSILWGVLIVFQPIAGILVFAWWIGAYALLFGVLMLGLAFRLRRHA